MLCAIYGVGVFFYLIPFFQDSVPHKDSVVGLLYPAYALHDDTIGNVASFDLHGIGVGGR